MYISILRKKCRNREAEKTLRTKKNRKKENCRLKKIFSDCRMSCGVVIYFSCCYSLQTHTNLWYFHVNFAIFFLFFHRLYIRLFDFSISLAIPHTLYSRNDCNCFSFSRLRFPLVLFPPFYSFIFLFLMKNCLWIIRLEWRRVMVKEEVKK